MDLHRKLVDQLRHEEVRSVQARSRRQLDDVRGHDLPLTEHALQELERSIPIAAAGFRKRTEK